MLPIRLPAQYSAAATARPVRHTPKPLRGEMGQRQVDALAGPACDQSFLRNEQRTRGLVRGRLLLNDLTNMRLPAYCQALNFGAPSLPTDPLWSSFVPRTVLTSTCLLQAASADRTSPEGSSRESVPRPAQAGGSVSSRKRKADQLTSGGETAAAGQSP